MQIIIAALVSALAATTLDFAKIETVVPQDWTVKGKGINDCTGGKCLLSSKPDGKEVFAGVDFAFRVQDTQYAKAPLGSYEADIQNDFQELYTNYLSASGDKLAYDGVNILVNPDSIYVDWLTVELKKLEATDAGKLTKDKVILTLDYGKYLHNKDGIDALNIKAIAVKFNTDPNFASDYKLENNVVCLADDVIGEKIYDACNGQVYNTETKHLDQLSDDVKKCDA